jgi:hypothetical protein
MSGHSFMVRWSLKRRQVSQIETKRRKQMAKRNKTAHPNQTNDPLKRLKFNGLDA